MPISTSSGPDLKKPQGPSSQGPPSNALVPVTNADEDEMMQDVAELAGGGQVSGQDALSNLETTLRPVEKYAVRFLEEVGDPLFFACLFNVLLAPFSCLAALSETH